MATTAFNDAQFASAYPAGIERHYWHRARIATIAAQLERADLRGAPIVEVGCGTGVVVRALRVRGFDCEGVELSDITIPEDLEGHIVAGTSFTELPASRRDGTKVVLLLDVIEHLEDPVIFLAQLRTSFPAMTHLLITVPARQELWSNYDEHYGHFRRYSVETVESTAHAAGFSPLVTRYFFHGLYLPARVLAALGGQRSVSVSAPAGALITVHRALAAWFRLEQHLLPAGFVGTSVISVLRAP